MQSLQWLCADDFWKPKGRNPVAAAPKKPALIESMLRYSTFHAGHAHV